MPDDSGKEDEGGLWRRIATARGMLVATGAIATALAAIIGLGRELLPHSPSRLGASIEPREVDRPVALDEFLRLTGRAFTPGEGRRRSFVLASATLAQTTEDTPPPPAETEEQGVPDRPRPEMPEYPEPGGGEPPDPPGPEPGGGEPPDPPGPEPGGQEPRSGHRQERRSGAPTSIDAFLRTVEPIIKAVKLPHSREPADEKRTEARATEALTGDPRASDREVRRVLSGTRLRLLKATETADTDESVETRPVFSIYRLPPGQRERLEPHGAVVNFNIKLEGYEGRPTELRWSLFNAKNKTRIRKPWLVNRLALRLTPDAPVDRASEAIWVPLPRKVKGPFVARLEVVDDKGVRVAYNESDPFR